MTTPHTEAPATSGGDRERPRLSGVITSFNEEHNIGQCIASMSWCDEIVLVDSFSTDRTPEIARSYDKVRFFQRPYFGAGAQKNWALQHVQHDWIFLRSIRFFRLFRLAKLGRYSAALRLLGQVLHAKRAELAMAVFIILILAVLAATGMYYVETEAQPQVFPDIPNSIFWSIAALTNVGHAEPVTAVGRILASVISILGIGMFALPTGILGAGFVEEFRSRRREATRCPHCGGEILPDGTAGAPPGSPTRQG